MINKDFEWFYMELYGISRLELEPWIVPFTDEKVVFTALKDVLEAELEISNAELSNGLITVACNQHDKSFNYKGGNLLLHCKGYKVFDQHKKEITLTQLASVANEYWENFGKK